MSEANETELTPEEQSMRAELLQVTSELEYEKNHALFLGYKVTEIDSNVISLTPDSAESLYPSLLLSSCASRFSAFRISPLISFSSSASALSIRS